MHHASTPGTVRLAGLRVLVRVPRVQGPRSEVDEGLATPSLHLESLEYR